MKIIVYTWPDTDIYAIQEALLWQRDRVMRLSLEILQQHNIPFEN